MATKTKIFDAVEMSRRLREDTSRLLASMSREDKINFLNKHLERFSKAEIPSNQQVADRANA
jgi:hypothetical protein